jgi:hypothetical protein
MSRILQRNVDRRCRHMLVCWHERTSKRVAVYLVNKYCGNKDVLYFTTILEM